MNKLTEIISKVLQKDYSAFYYTPPYYKDAKSYLFTNPNVIAVFYRDDNIKEYFHQIDALREKYKYGISTINYETGYLFEKRLSSNKKLDCINEPVMMFAFYEEAVVFESGKIDHTEIKMLMEEKGYDISGFNLNTDKEKYTTDIEKIKHYISEGDTYQVNYTVKGKFGFRGDISSLFAGLIFNQSAQYNAIINLPDRYLISISPELFFKTEGDKITARPMKGTIKRGVPHDKDFNNKEELRQSAKDRAENIMIVDLLRNDIGRICEFDSVKAVKEYEIEKYESLYQMTSMVEGKLSTDKLSSIIKNVFPCGSITGAPKIRTMRIISELESEPRGIYTGAIGMMQNDNTVFNVPIRTIKIEKETGLSEIGIGSGIVWDSDAENEYDETLLKANFLLKPDPYFELFESILYKDGEYFLLDYHLKRLEESADYFLFKYNEERVIEHLRNIEIGLAPSTNYKIKLTLNKWGGTKAEYNEIGTNPDEVNIVLSNEIIDSDSKFQYFKTTNRALYDEELRKYRSKGFYDVLFMNRNDEIAECAITNIFMEADGVWYTPPAASGILNGCYRQYLLERNDHKEKAILLDELRNAERVKIVNSVREELFVNQIAYKEDIIWSYKDIVK